MLYGRVVLTISALARRDARSATVVVVAQRLSERNGCLTRFADPVSGRRIEFKS